MELGLLGLFMLLGLALQFEGYTSKNPYMIYAGAILLMITGTSIHLNGISYPNGAQITELADGTLQIVYTYAQKTDWYVTSVGTLSFLLGFFGMTFYIADYTSKKRGEFD